METYDEINDATGFANGDRFASEADIRAYFAPDEQRTMFGEEAETDPGTLSRWAEAVIAHRWHMAEAAK